MSFGSKKKIWLPKQSSVIWYFVFIRDFMFRVRIPGPVPKCSLESREALELDFLQSQSHDLELTSAPRTKRRRPSSLTSRSEKLQPRNYSPPSPSLPPISRIYYYFLAKSKKDSFNKITITNNTIIFTQFYSPIWKFDLTSKMTLNLSNL